MTKSFPIRFLGTGSYVPETVRTNQHFAQYLDTSDEWIVSRTGIRERRVVSPGEATSTLAARAAREALSNANLAIDDVDVIICATATGDHGFPATATLVQQALGAKSIPAFDVNGACAGFLFALTVGSTMLVSGMYRRVLVIGAESLTRFSDFKDRATGVLFGDAAGAAVLAMSDDDSHQIVYSHLGTDGKRAKLIWLPAGGAALPASERTVAERLHFLHMNGREVYKFAVIKMKQLIDDALTATGLTPDDLKLVIPHQSNLRIIESVQQKMGLPPEKISVNIDRYGNTSAASIPMALDEARRKGVVQSGDLILMVAIGAGITWAAMIIRL